MKSLLKKAVDTACKEIKEGLAVCTSRIRVALDCWSSSNSYNFMGMNPSLYTKSLIIAITCHYVDESFNLQKDLLDFCEVSVSHTGANLIQHVFEVLIKYNIHDQIYCITTDNAGNNGTLCESLSAL